MQHVEKPHNTTVSQYLLTPVTCSNFGEQHTGDFVANRPTGSQMDRRMWPVCSAVRSYLEKNTCN